MAHACACTKFLLLLPSSRAVFNASWQVRRADAPTVELPPLTPSALLAALIRLATVVKPLGFIRVPVTPAALHADTVLAPMKSVSAGFWPWSVFNSIAVNCTESIYAILVAFALRSQLLRAVLPLLSCVVVGLGQPVGIGSNAAPAPFTRLSVSRKQRSEALSSPCPFLLLQNPSVSPESAPRQTLPKFTVAGGVRPEAERAVVATQTGAALGITSQTPYVPLGSRFVKEYAPFPWVSSSEANSYRFVLVFSLNRSTNQKLMPGSPGSCTPFKLRS